FVTGAGAKARNSIGLVLVGGMTIGTIFTLFIVPSLYVLIAKTHHEGREESDDDQDNDPDLSSDEVADAPQYAEPAPAPALARKRAVGADGESVWQPA
ncbi:MAG TPA: efflux RND transporter permease subunit, partial [Chthoniobacterales bacterium]